MPNIPAENTAPARPVADSALPNGPTLRRSLDQYANCTPAAVSGGSQAQMFYFVEDAKHDIAALVDALKKAQSKLTFAKRWQNWAEDERAKFEARALAAESRVKEAQKVLAPFTAYSVGKIAADEHFSYCIYVCCSRNDQPQFAHFDAVRAFLKTGRAR